MTARKSKAIELAAQALDLAAALNAAGDGTTLPANRFRNGALGPWGHAEACARSCLADVFDAVKAEALVLRAIETGEHDAASLAAFAQDYDRGRARG